MSYTKQNSRVTRVQMDVTYTSGTPVSVNVTTYLVSSFVNVADASDTTDAPTWSDVRFDLLGQSVVGMTITGGGKVVTYPQLAALIRQASLDQANAIGIQ